MYAPGIIRDYICNFFKEVWLILIWSIQIQNRDIQFPYGAYYDVCRQVINTGLDV